MRINQPFKERTSPEDALLARCVFHIFKRHAKLSTFGFTASTMEEI